MYKELSQLRELEWDPERLHAVAEQRLASVLRVAAGLAFYTDRGLSGKLNSFEQLKGLPLLGRADLQMHLSKLRNSGVAGGLRKTTGGSTGEPVTVVKSRSGVARERAASWLGYGWFGIERGQRGVRFWGQAERGERRLRARLADIAMNRRLMSAFAFRDEELWSYWKAVLRYRPSYFYGYASMLEEFGRFVLRERLPGADLGLVAITATAEPLTETRRKAITDAFHTPVQDEYGCGEVGPIAYECQEGVLHVMSQNVFVEVLKEDGSSAEPGESGEVIVTDLSNHATPLLRYALGDHATVAAPCKCGRAFPGLSAIWGRAYDYLEDAQGRRYHGEAVMYIFEDLRDAGVTVRQFQVLQDMPGRIRVRIVPEGEVAVDRMVSVVKDACERRLGEMQAAVECVDSIARARSGKSQIIRRVSERQTHPRRRDALEAGDER